MMRKHFATVVIAIAVLVGLSTLAGTAQDNYERRIGDLETRVALLEQIVATAPAVSGETHDITGTYIVGKINDPDGSPCRVTSTTAYDPGTPVLVFDDQGALAGEGELENGIVREGECHLPFRIEDVPTSDIYTFYLGQRSPFGGRDFTFSALEEAGWNAEIRIVF